MDQKLKLLELSVQLVSAYVGNNQVARRDLPQLVAETNRALAQVLAEQGTRPEESAARAPVSVKKSVTPEFLICLEDGKKFKSLKRHLRSRYNLTPEQYREKWNLPPDYPMVAPLYAEERSSLAKRMGLGRSPR